MIKRLFAKKSMNEEQLIAASDEHCAHIENLVQEKDIKGAIRLTKRFQKKFPYNIRGIGNSAIMISEAGDVRAAIELFTTLYEQNPDDANSALNLAVCYNRLEHRDVALEYVTEAYQIDPKNVGACVCLSESLFVLNKVEESLQVCLDAIARNTEHHLIWFCLGCCKMREGASEEACDAFKNSLEIDPTHFESFANYGATLVGMKDWDKAEGIILQALELRPDDGVTLCNLAQIYEAQDRTDDAYRLYKRSTKVDHEYERAYADVERLAEQLGISQ